VINLQFHKFYISYLAIFLSQYSNIHARLKLIGVERYLRLRHHLKWDQVKLLGDGQAKFRGVEFAISNLKQGELIVL
jgi:hypothetical protein